MKKFLLALICLAGVPGMSSCSALEGLLEELEKDVNEGIEQVSSDVTRDEMNTQGWAIKLDYFGQYESKNATLVYSRKDKKYRWDSVGRTIYSYWYDRGTESARQYYGYVDDPGEWEDAMYYQCQQSVNNLFNEWINDCSSLLQNYGFSKTGTTTILGLPCDVWTGTYTKEGKAFGAVAYGIMTESEGNTGEFCVWNGITLRTTVNGKVQTQATNIVIGIPDEAFTDTLDINWID